MKPFLDKNFLLKNDVAEQLYHDHAAIMPILDYHCHLSPRDIAEDRKFDNLTQAWLEGDHYKWRAMRTNGVDEAYVTGDASDWEKFEKWAETVPHTLRNPLYHWTHLELKRYFDIYDLLDGHSAKMIYESASALLHKDELSCRGILRKMGVKVVCTTDDPVDDLRYHQQIKKDAFEVKVFPAFRPDKAYAVEQPENYNTYLDQLSEVSGVDISNFDQLLEALHQRIDYFQANGCRLSDHGLEKIPGETFSTAEINSIFNKLRQKKPVTALEAEKYMLAILMELGKAYHSKGWVQQFHLGALRNVNSRMRLALGPDTGFDSIGDFRQAPGLARLLDHLDSTNQLTKTILYNLNPVDNELIATMIGNFNDGSFPGKMQHGSAWWFLDQKDGMEKQIDALSNMGLLSRFVGMLTDSRSFLSLPRHEYFRRILCNQVAKDVVNGELPDKMGLLGEIVENICYHNAKKYFGF